MKPKPRKPYTRKPARRRVMPDGVDWMNEASYFPHQRDRYPGKGPAFEIGPLPLPKRIASFCIECGELLTDGAIRIHARCALNADRTDVWLDDFNYAADARGGV